MPRHPNAFGGEAFTPLCGGWISVARGVLSHLAEATNALEWLNSIDDLVPEPLAQTVQSEMLSCTRCRVARLYAAMAAQPPHHDASKQTNSSWAQLLRLRWRWTE